MNYELETLIMRLIKKLSALIPYLYFMIIALIAFTDLNRVNGIYTYPILLIIIPILWQLFKPNKILNFTLGVTFAYISSFLVLGYISDVLGISSQKLANGFILYGGLFVLTNFIMSFWIIINSLKRTF